jgi:hypothetical protein
MMETIARLNVQHFRKLLAQDIDETKRCTIVRLLAEEQEKLWRWEQEPARQRTCA